MIPIRRRLYQSQPGFSPRQLFASLQGAWLEPTPGYIWQENTGVTPTTTGGQTIGLMLDQSQGAVLGPELVTNGDFSSGTTGWITAVTGGNAITISGGSLRIQATGADACVLTQNAITTAGKWYKVEFDLLAGSSGQLKVLPIGGTTGEILFSCVPGRKTFNSLVVSGTQLQISRVAGQAADAYIDNISVREILGNHGSQSTAANRPTYQLNSGLPLARHDATDSLVVSLPNLGSGVYSASGSVYFATPVGMSALHNQSMGTTYTLPALSTDIYAWMVFPQRLSSVQEGRLERYMLRKAGLAVPDYLTDDFGETITDDIGDPILAG